MEIESRDIFVGARRVGEITSRTGYEGRVEVDMVVSHTCPSCERSLPRYVSRTFVEPCRLDIDHESAFTAWLEDTIECPSCGVLHKIPVDERRGIRRAIRDDGATRDDIGRWLAIAAETP